MTNFNAPRFVLEFVPYERKSDILLKFDKRTSLSCNICSVMLFRKFAGEGENPFTVIFKEKSEQPFAVSYLI